MNVNDLTQVLADHESEANVLRKHGQHAVADAIAKVCGDVRDATEAYRSFLNETDAQLYSGKKVRWLRARFPAWLDEGNARWRDQAREYRQMILPRRPQVGAAFEAGRRAGQESAA